MMVRCQVACTAAALWRCPRRMRQA